MQRKPCPVGKPLVDDETGYRVQILTGCVVTKPFVAEARVYNEAMRAWHTKQFSTSPALTTTLISDQSTKRKRRAFTIS